MTDVPDGSGQIPRRTPRVSDGGAPVSGALAIVLAIVAVVAGFLILRSISDGGADSADFPDPSGSAAGANDGSDDSPDATDPGSSVPALPTTTTTPPLIKLGASIVVANANGQGGTAGSMSRAIATDGFTVVDPTDASSAVNALDESVIYFDPAVPAAQDVANSLARVLGGVSSIAPLEGTPPTKDGTLNGGNVLLMLGLDKANKTLAELAPAEAAGDVVTVTNPDTSGTTTTTG
jgi:LytR cell envelope-related transcriptional attenuator